MARWSVAVAIQARIDIQGVLDWTARNFGMPQRRQYRAAIQAALLRLREGPDLPGSRLLHLLIYEAGPDRRITVLRVLHDTMDLPRHLPGDT